MQTGPNYHAVSYVLLRADANRASDLWHLAEDGAAVDVRVAAVGRDEARQHL